MLLCITCRPLNVKLMFIGWFCHISSIYTTVEGLRRSGVPHMRYSSSTLPVPCDVCPCHANHCFISWSSSLVKQIKNALKVSVSVTIHADDVLFPRRVLWFKQVKSNWPFSRAFSSWSPAELFRGSSSVSYAHRELHNESSQEIIPDIFQFPAKPTNGRARQIKITSPG